MGVVQIEFKDQVAIVRMNNGVTNAISPELLTDLTAALERVKREARGIVLAGGPKFFSIGLDLPNLLPLDRPAMADYFKQLNQFWMNLYSIPLPTTAAVMGHAPAAGTIMAVACDYRFAAAGKPIFGYNEIKIGLSVPYLAGLMLGQVVGERIAARLCYEGEFLKPEPAREIGLLDRLLPTEEVEDRAVRHVSQMARLKGKAFAGIKNTRVHTIRDLYKTHGGQADQDWLDLFMDPDTRLLLTEAAQKF